MAFDFEAARAARGQTSLNEASIAELLDLRNQIDSRLPARELKDLNLEEELIMQYTIAKELQTRVMQDGEVPANQQAQVLNACVSALDKLQDTQAKFYSQERFKRIESILISALKKWPEDLAGQFLDEYEKMLDGSNV